MSGNDLINIHGLGPHAHDPGYSGTSLVQCCIAMLILSTTAVALRFVSRFTSKDRRLWWDDWTALISWAILTAMIAVAIDCTNHGLGRHIGTMTWNTFYAYQLRLYILSPLYTWALTFAKFSALFFCVRVFTLKKTWFRWSVWALFILCGSWCITLSFLSFFQCVPVDSIWSSKLATRCLPSFYLFYITTIPNIIIDFMILLLPMPLIYQLHNTTKRKLGVAAVYAAGYATFGLAITRLAIGLVFGSTPDDTTWNMQPLQLGVLEPSICLIGVCLPAQISLVRWASGKIKDGSTMFSMSSRLDRRSDRFVYERNYDRKSSTKGSTNVENRNIESADSFELKERVGSSSL